MAELRKIPSVKTSRDADRFYISADMDAAFTAAEEQAKTGRTQEGCKDLDGKRIADPHAADLIQPPKALLGIRPAVAQGAAEPAEFFHAVQIVSMISDPAHPGDGGTVLRADADHEIIGDREGLAVDAVAVQDPADALLYPEGLRAAHGQLIAQIHRQIQQSVVVHMTPRTIRDISKYSTPVSNCKGRKQDADRHSEKLPC